MSEKVTVEKVAEDVLNNIVETLTDNLPKEKSDQVTSQLKRLFGRERPVHHVLGGGKSADVLLWRNKKISASVLASATSIWVLFEWLNYHFFSLLCFTLITVLLVEFIWTSLSGAKDRSQVPRIDLPDKLFINVATLIGSEVNKGLGFLQDVACSGNLQQFLVVVASLFAAALIGSCCNFLTLLYIGFVAAHTVPVLYEKYEDQIEKFVNNLLQQLQQYYGNATEEPGKKHE